MAENTIINTDALRKKFSMFHGWAYKEEILGIIKALEEARTCLDLMHSYLAHQDQDANHEWMAKKMREALWGGNRADAECGLTVLPRETVAQVTWALNEARTLELDGPGGFIRSRKSIDAALVALEASRSKK